MMNTMTMGLLAVTFAGAVTTPRAALAAVEPPSIALLAGNVPGVPGSGLGAAPHDDGSDSGDDGDDDDSDD